MIESNLQLASSCIFFLAVVNSLDDSTTKIYVAIYITILLILIIWPFFMIYFLYKKKNHLKTNYVKVEIAELVHFFLALFCCVASPLNCESTPMIYVVAIKG